MRVRRARVPIALACLMVAAGGASCGSDSSPDDSTPSPRIDLVVGDILPLTGPEAGLGASAQKAAQLAVEKINDAIGQANVDHALEIVHEDQGARGATHAARALIAAGSRCLVGPRSRAAIADLAANPPPPGRVMIYPNTPSATVSHSGTTVGLPSPGHQIALTSQPRGEHDPVAAFAALYESTDPPIGPAQTSDARQFDAVVLCYLAAVANGSAGPRMSESIGPPREARAFSWQRLANAILALQQGKPITYAGITGRFGLAPPP